MKFVRALVLFLVIGFALTGATALAGEQWATDPATGVKIGIVFTADDATLVSASWSGPAAGGLAEGQGKLQFVIKDKAGKEAKAQCEAEMKAGKLNGKVSMVWSDGDTFDGYYRDGLRDGQGLYRWASGASYDGEWKEGLYEGKGVLKLADGRSYEGDFRKSKQNGFGVGRDASGKVIHEGEWKDGAPVIPLKADKVLGIPWGASEEEAKSILLKRPNTIRVSFLDGKDGEHRWLYFGGPFADFPDAWIYVHFYQGKMWQVRISWPLKDDQIMDRFTGLYYM